MKLKINELAVIYYNLETPDRYDINSNADKEKARLNFLNSLNFDSDRLEKAFDIYLLAIRKEFDTLLTTKTAKKEE